MKRLGTDGLLWRSSNHRHCAVWWNQEPPACMPRSVSLVSQLRKSLPTSSETERVRASDDSIEMSPLNRQCCYSRQLPRVSAGQHIYQEGSSRSLDARDWQ